MKFLLLAQAGAVDQLHLPPDNKGGWSVAWVFVAVGAIVLVALLWALFIRPQKKVTWGPEHSDYRPPEPTNRESSGHSHGRRRRRRRRDHRPRNPTLAETGGLPPVRSDSGSDAGD